MVFKAALTLLSLAASATLSNAVNFGATGYVDVAVYGGTPDGKAAGILYGVPNQVAYDPNTAPSFPDSLATDAGITYVRTGGAQTPYPGWGMQANRGNYQGYEKRFASSLENYRSARRWGAKVVLLPHDIWGGDAYADLQKGEWPCDNGDCSEYSRFLDRLIADLKSNSMVEGLAIDIWNEPDGYGFWPRSQDQFHQMYSFSFNKFRSAFPTSSGVLLQGPATEQPPGANNGWWQAHGAYLQKNPSVIPDVYSYHALIGRYAADCGNDPVTMQQDFDALRGKYCLPIRPVQINEFAYKDEQTPGYYAWFISRLERVGVSGLRANWGSRVGLHNDLARLLLPSSDGKSWSKLGEWHVAQYYRKTQTGKITLAGAAGSKCFDLYVTQDRSAGRVNILAGVRGQEGPYPINVKNVRNMPQFANLNALRATIKEIPFNNLGAVSAPTILQNAASVPIDGNGWVNFNLTLKLDSAYTIDLFA